MGSKECVSLSRLSHTGSQGLRVDHHRWHDNPFGGNCHVCAFLCWLHGLLCIIILAMLQPQACVRLLTCSAFHGEVRQAKGACFLTKSPGSTRQYRIALQALSLLLLHAVMLLLCMDFLCWDTVQLA